MAITTSNTHSGSRFFTLGPVAPSHPDISKGSDKVGAAPYEEETNEQPEPDSSVSSPEDSFESEVIGLIGEVDDSEWEEDGSFTESDSDHSHHTEEDASFSSALLPKSDQDSQKGWGGASRAGYLDENGKLNVGRPQLDNQSGRDVRPSNHTTIFDVLLKYGHDEGFAPVEHDESFVPTTAPAGSPEKIEIMAERVQAGLPLFHEEDRVDYDGLTAAIRPRD